ncbi:MAG: transglutaminase domain-containing protein [Lentisphaeria bacterium]|nr:transglutaminase-like domain-containing protein [Lentisphaeria bacterium]NQZ67877.1 transglutaminase domain-containing protein [Lentisphaeria bacterium]
MNRDNTIETNLKSRLISFETSVCILSPSIAFALLSNQNLFLFLVSTALFVSFLITRPIEMTSRSVIYACTICCILTAFMKLAFKSGADLYFLPVDIVLPFFIYFAIACSFFRQSILMISTILTCSLAALMILGTCLSDPITGFLSDGIFRDRFIIYKIFLIIEIWSVLYLLLEIRRFNHSTSGQRTLFYNFTYFVSLTVAVCLSAGMIFTLNNSYDALERFFRPFSIYKSHRNSVKIKLFNERANLSQTRHLKNHRQLNQEVLRVKSKIPPGYMRGKAYVTYKQGIWTSQNKMNPLPLQEQSSTISSRIYQKNPATNIQTLEKIDVYFNDYFRSETLFLPADFDAIELVADDLMQNPDGVLTSDKWDVLAAYTAFVKNPAKSQSAAYPEPQKPGKLYSQLPKSVEYQFEAIASTIYTEEMSDDLKIRKTISYLLRDFSYSLDDQDPKSMDPVLNFLLIEKKGHCELFASAAALLLRTQNIPTRYITGFVCMERYTKDTWVARMKHCHAWAEAWTPEKGWQWVEATPASGQPEISESAESILTAISMYTRSMFAKVKRGYFAEFITDFFYGIYLIFRWLFIQGPWWFCWPLLIAMLTFYTHRKYKFMDSRLGQFDKFNKIFNHYLKKHGSYQENRSLRESLNEAISKNSPGSNSLILVLDEYENRRFNPEMDKKDLKSLLIDLKMALSDIKKLSEI